MVKKEHWSFALSRNLESFFFCLFLLFLPTQLGKHFWPAWSYLVGIRSDYLSPTIYFTDLLLVIVFCLSWYRSLSGIRARLIFKVDNANLQFKIQSPPNANILFAIGYLVFAFFLWPGDRTLELYGICKLAEMIGLFVYLKQKLFKQYTLDQIGMAFGVGITVECVLTIAQFLTQGSLDGIWYWLGERHYTIQTINIAAMSLAGNLMVRPYASFSHPNVLGGYALVMSIMFLFFSRNAQTIVKNQKSKTAMYIAFFMISSLVVFLSFSRLAIVVWGIVLLCSLLLSIKKRKGSFRSFPLFASLCALLLLVTLLVFNIPGRFTSLSLSDESVVQRTTLLQASAMLFQAHPLIGVGIKNFLPSLAQLPGFSTNFYSLQPVHNIFVLILVETGLVGAIFFAWLVFSLLLPLIQQYSTTKNKNLVNMCFMLVLAIGLIGLGDHYWLTSQQGLLLFTLVFGMISAVKAHFN